MHTADSVKILDHRQVNSKIERIAWQIYEHFAETSELTLIGIEGNGLSFAKLLIKKLQEISEINITEAHIVINKTEPQSHLISLNIGIEKIKGKDVILIDDVLNTGKTMMYALCKIMEYGPQKIQVAVVVDRDHKMFPIKADFVGLSLSTNIQEHVSVELAGQDFGVFLS